MATSKEVAKRADKHIDSKGRPTHQVTGVPGYNKGTGTPAWVAKAARAAERKAK